MKTSIRLEGDNKMLNQLLLILLAAITIGCAQYANYAEITNMALARSYKITGLAAKPLSTCIENSLTENYGGTYDFRRIFDQRRNRWFVFASHRNYRGITISSNYSYSLAFQDGVEGVIVELRSLKTIYGGFWAPEKKLEQHFRECTTS